jgi:hypothetical protein
MYQHRADNATQMANTYEKFLGKNRARKKKSIDVDDLQHKKADVARQQTLNP